MKQKVASILKSVRNGLGLRPEDVSEQLKKYNVNISPITIRGYENGVSQPKADVFALLCKIYGISSLDIFFSDDIQLSDSETPYKNLNQVGRSKADEYISDLLVNPKYTVKETSSSESTHIVWQAAKSDDNAAPSIVELDEETMQKLRNAPRVKSDKDL